MIAAHEIGLELESGPREEDSHNFGLCRGGLTRAFHHVADRGDHQIGLVELDPVATVRGDQVATAR